MSQIESSTESLAPERMSRATEIAGERMSKLASALNTRYKQSGDIQDLENAILCYRYLLRRLCPPGHPRCLECFMKLTTTLHIRYQHFGNSKDLDEAISLLLGLFRSCPLGHPNRWFSLNNLAGVLLTRYDDFGNANDLKDSISLYREALSLCPHGHPNRSTSLNNLAAALSTCYRKWGNANDLEDSISFHREALNLRPPGQPYCSTALNSLAAALEIRYSSFGNANDLEECLSLLRNALSLRPHGHPDRSVSLNNLARALGVRYDNLGIADDLEESISFHRQALSLRPPGHPHRATSLNNLAIVLTARYDNLGIVNDLDDSIAFLRQTLSLSPPGHPDYSTSLNNIATALSSRYDEWGNVNDLEDSISFHRKALSLCPPGHPLRPALLNNLAGALNTRYNKLGNADDLEDSISCHRETLNLCPPGHPNLSTSLNNLAAALSTRYGKFGDGKDLRDSISFYWNAVSLLPLEHPNRPASLDGLAAALLAQYVQSAGGTDDDLEACIFALNYSSLHLRPPGHPVRSISLNNLANTLQTRYDKFGDINDLKGCISLRRDALSLRPHGNASRSASLASLGISLITLSRHVQMGRPEDVSEAFLCFAQAASDSTPYIHDRLGAAALWVNSAHAHNHETIFSAYTTLFQLINHSLIFHSNVETQQRFLANANIPKSLASDAAAAAVAAQNIELAVEFLEQGRALLWSKVDAYKHPLDELRQASGGAKLADRLQAISAKLEHLSFVSSSATLNKESSEKAAILDNRMKEHRVLSEEWEDLVQKVRKIDGFGHFLRAAPFNILQSAAAEGPVILVNISEYRSDAIILLKDIPPQLVNLPEVRLPELCGQKCGTAKEIANTVAYLWDTIASPVVDRLDKLKVAKGSRIWWCPTAELCALPLHAAGRGKRNLLDICISSYTSTLSSLIKARLNVIQPPIIPKLLVVGQPSTDLKRVRDEVDVIRNLRPGVDVLFGPGEANREAVLEGLKAHSWVHFACHGLLGDEGQPFHASFKLHEDPKRRLPLLDLIRARLPNAELAFLSACHSAAGGLSTPDESIHLSAALQFCGFKSVVGTLWEMDDEDGPTISEKFYKHMYRNPEKIDIL